MSPAREKSFLLSRQQCWLRGNGRTTGGKGEKGTEKISTVRSIWAWQKQDDRGDKGGRQGGCKNDQERNFEGP